MDEQNKEWEDKFYEQFRQNIENEVNTQTQNALRNVGDGEDWYKRMKESMQTEIAKHTQQAMNDAYQDYKTLKGEVRTRRGQLCRQDRRIEEGERRHQLNTLIADGIIRNYDLPLKTDIAVQLSNATELTEKGNEKWSPG